MNNYAQNWIRLGSLDSSHSPGENGPDFVEILGTGAIAPVYGEVLDAMYQGFRHGLKPTEDSRRVALGLLDFLESNWDQPDEGIWEVRGKRRHFTHSRMMAWVAFDRAVRVVEWLGVEAPLQRWCSLRDEIHAQVCREGYDAEVGAFVQFYGSRRLDASLLMIPLVGFLPPHDVRVRGTIEAIQRDLVT